MNKHKKLIVFLGILLAVVLVVGGLLIWGNQGTQEVTETHIDWYDPETKEFTLTTVEELYGLAILSEQYDFGGQTVRLGADIALNSGDAASWAKQPPVNVWMPVNGFAGIFDGQGHTISGVYAVGVNNSVGLFTDTKGSAKIQNLRLENSFIKGMSDKGTGSIIGSGAGVLENIYSNAIVECQSSNCGGLVGFMREGKTNLIQNCWFDGSVQGTNGTSSYVGGIVGRVLSNSGIPKIAHCLNTADVSAKSEYAGGFVGAVVGESSLWIVDSLSLGGVQANEGTAKVGMAVGSVFSQATLNLQTSWVAEGNYDSKVGETLGKVKGVCGTRSMDMLQDTAAYTYTTLDFDNYWAARKNETPVLQSFSQEKLSLADVEKLIDVSWFDETATTLHIKDVAQFYGFQFLSQAYSFSGQILFLDADLTLNSGDAKTWEKNAPKYEWAPIGRHVDEAGKTIGVVFAGTFDGQGHTISGVYMGIDSTKAFAYGMFGKTSGTIKNLSLKNSYIGGTAGGNVGSVAASFAGGKMESVYSDAIVHVQANHVGGLVGRNESTAKFTNCWFDGDVIGNERVGGIMGSMNNNTTLEIYHCLNSGKIHANSYYAGGLSGLISNGTGVIEDSLNVGMISTDKGAGWSGGITGVVNGKAGIGVKATLKDVYTMMGTYKQMYGMNGDEHKITGPGGVILKEEELTGKNAYLWANLNFEEYWTITEKGTPILKTFAKETIPVSGGKLADVNWYSVQGKSFNIDTPAKLRGLMLLSRTNDFKGQTINLTKSISISGRNWEPIGTHIENNGKTMGKAFAGTFNGNGNKISGMTMQLQGKEVAYGLFGQVSGTVKNLSVTDSKITGTATSAVGTVAGALRGNGKLENIYSNSQVNVTANYVGGIVGKIEKNSTCAITNCWNDGKVSGKERVAGIVGYATSGVNLSISHCLNTQQIYATSIHYTAGICGLADQCAIEITDCLNTGAITCPEGQKLGYSGAILGAVNGKAGAKGKSTINHAYYLSSSCSKGSNAIAANAQHITVSGIGTISVSQPRLTDKAALQWTTLDFANYWSVAKDSTPVLAAYTQNPIKGKAVADISWYNPGKTSFTINNKAQLLGLSLLSQAVDFAGKTVTLGADIDLSGESWEPVGLHVDAVGNVVGVAFAGTFDGNGKSVTGMKATPSGKASSWGFFGQISGTLKNLTVSGSIEGTANQVGGAVAGLRAGAALENVTSNVNLTITGNNVGGVVSRIEKAGDYTIANCTYTGQMAVTGSNVGGIIGDAYTAQKLTISGAKVSETAKISGTTAVGGIIGNTNNDNDITIINAANSAAVTGTGNNVGGIVGYNGKTALKIKDCVNNGAVSGTNQVGGILAQNNHSDTSVISCTNNGAVSGTGTGSNIGGVVGYNGKASVEIRDCTNSGTVSGVTAVGGIIGIANNGNEETTTIADCKNAATVTGTAIGIGGVAGKIEAGSKGVITNCWNDGEISGNERIAGIVGLSAKGAELKIGHCLNTKQINTVSAHYAAGICGLADQSIIEILDCLSVGTITCTTQDQKLGYSGAILGAVNGTAASKGKATVSNAFYLSSSCTKGANVVAGNAEHITMDGTGAVGVTAARLTGANASQWTTLDFANYWSVVENATPVLAYFIENPTKSDSVVDVSWYDAGKDNFTIMNKAQLLGLRLLSQSVDFAGKTVTLGADIDLAGESWLPIGLHVDSDGSVIGVAFAGTFDGNGKSITGMNAAPSGKAGSWGLFGQIAGTVKNLTVSGTIQGTANQVGGITGAMRNGAKLENVTSNVDMTITGTNVGGIAGRVEHAGDYTISGCAYGGTLSVTGNNAAGILGNVNTAGKLTISNCMTTEDVQVSGAGAVGGIVGTAGNNNTVTISGCNNAAAVSGNDNVGGIVGINGSTTLAVQNCENTGAITAATGTAGGILGQTLQATVSITGCGNTGTISGVTNAGGIVGKAAANANVNVVNSTNTGNCNCANATTLTISTVDELLRFAEMVKTDNFSGKTVNLYADLDLTNVAWAPIGLHVNANGTAVGTAFAGTFNGNGHTISGINAAPSGKASSWGFFGQIAGTVKNFTVSGSMTGTGNQMGGVTAALRKGAKVENVTCNVDLTITGTNVGGITGRVEHAGDYTISGCTYSGTLSATGDNVGGILGYVNTAGKATVNNCTITADAQISGKGAVGGIIGHTGNNNTVAVTGCTNNAVVSGTGNNVGGIVGYNGTTKLTISGCNNNAGANISGAGMVGGILGQATATKHTELSPDTGIAIAPDVTITGCKNYGNVNGTSDYVGGIIGISNQCALLLENCHNGGSVATTKNTNYRGSIAGGLHGTAASRGYVTFTGVTYLTGTCSQAYFVNPGAASGGHIDLNVDDCIEVAADGTPVAAMLFRIAPVKEDEALSESEEEVIAADSEEKQEEEETKTSDEEVKSGT